MPTITSRSNPRLQQLRAAFAGNKRLAGGLIALEGRHLVEEAVRSGLPLQTLFIADGLRDCPEVPAGVEVLLVADEVLGSALETRSPQGVAALLRPPSASLEAMLTGLPLLLVAVGLQDPGNLGTLIRSAEAFGATGVLMTPGTVSAWNGKCIRASAGSVLRVPVAEADLGTAAVLRKAGVQLLAAVRTGGHPTTQYNLSRGCAFLIGNEGAGLPDSWLLEADARLSIPCPGPVESLNAAVAGSLLLYEASRQRTRP